MPLDPPPHMPPTEHIPAVDQPSSQQQPANVIHKPMGAMATSSDGKDRKEDADERLAWEQKNRDKSESMNEMEDNAPSPRSALSARMAGGSKGGDPFLNGVVEGTNDGLDPFKVAEDKKELQDIMNNNSNAAPPVSTSDISTNLQETISSGDEPSTSQTNAFPGSVISTGNKPRTRSKPPTSSSSDRNLDRASAKNSEIIARAGSGNAFSGSVLGVGGLDDVLAQIQRRVWIPLAAPPSLLSELGIQPVRGLLLYGQPGCGKTLLARKLGSILSPCRPITIVSGPEILDKFGKLCTCCLSSICTQALVPCSNSLTSLRML